MKKKLFDWFIVKNYVHNLIENMNKCQHCQFFSHIFNHHDLSMIVYLLSYHRQLQCKFEK
jgi:hypothetical protein